MQSGLGPKTASKCEQSRGPLSPVAYLIYARLSVIIVCQPLLRQVELTIICAMVNQGSNLDKNKDRTPDQTNNSSIH